MGYGLHMTPEKMMGGTWSAHNWYIQILIQMGFTGFILMIGMMGIIWSALCKLSGSKVARNTAAFMLAVLVWQCFEVSITQNNFTIGIVVWLVMGMGISIARNRQ